MLASVFAATSVLFLTLYLLTYRRNSRKELETSREVLNRVINAVADPIFVKDRQHRWLLINDAFCRFIGHSREELIGKTDTDFFEPEQVRVFWKKDEEVFLSRTLNINEEELTDAQGNHHVIITKKSLFTGSDGEEYLVGMISDVTAAKKSEAILRRSEKLAAMGQLAAGVAHEINNPLSVILGFAESMGKKLPADDALRHAVNSIEREAQRCRTLVQNLLFFSRDHKQGLSRESLIPTIEGALSLIETQARVRNSTVIRHFPSQLPDVLINRNQIQQVIINLCTNALDAMPKGGAITIHVGQEKSQVLIRLTDTGTGIPAEIQDKVFNPFFTTKEVGKGTGLGLSLAHEIIQQHNGEISFQSTPGQGTTFLIQLPIAAKTEVAPPVSR